jgi:hypothetical protein
MLYKEDLNNTIKIYILQLNAIQIMLKHIKKCNLFLKEKYNEDKLLNSITDINNAIKNLEELT